MKRTKVNPKQKSDQTSRLLLFVIQLGEKTKAKIPIVPTKIFQVLWFDSLVNAALADLELR
jgi:hypothetical protein